MDQEVRAKPLFYIAMASKNGCAIVADDDEDSCLLIVSLFSPSSPP